MKRLLLLSTFTIFLVACDSTTSEEKVKSGVSDLNQKELQYYSVGKKLYGTYCANCHTEQGVGLGSLIPPLKDSDYLMQDLARAARIIKYGQKGPLTVNGIEFNQPMPANPRLTDLEIAEVITYISNSWGNAAKGMTTQQVKKALIEGSADL